MNTRYLALAFLPALFATACDPVVAPEVGQTEAPSFAIAQGSPHIMADGTFTQTAITGLEATSSGPNSILEQTSVGTVSGTLSGSYEDDLRVVIHPNGRFNAQFTITCLCVVDGKEGTLELTVSDAGEMVGPTLASFWGRAVITGGSGELAGLGGVLDIEGTVDLTTGLSTYDYSGSIH